MLFETLAPLIVSWMVVLSPPERDALRVTYPEAQESVEERRTRYEEIARDIAHAVEGLRPGERKGAAELLVAISWHESGWAKDVDSGVCAPGRLRIGGCDGGRAKSVFQVQGHEMATREDAARVALRLAHRSFKACKDLPAEERLASYAAGTCASRMGKQRSREVWTVLKRVRAIKNLRAVKGSG